MELRGFQTSLKVVGNRASPDFPAKSLANFPANSRRKLVGTSRQSLKIVTSREKHPLVHHNKQKQLLKAQ